MFERYTEKARQAIFFARYEVSQLGAPEIDTEHLLLGVLRADKHLGERIFPAGVSLDSLRKQIEGRTTIGEKISTSEGIPLSGTAKNVLYRAAQEADSLSSKSIGTEHLLLGLLREVKSLAAKVLRENNIEYEAVRREFEK